METAGLTRRPAQTRKRERGGGRRGGGEIGVRARERDNEGREEEKGLIHEGGGSAYI